MVSPSDLQNKAHKLKTDTSTITKIYIFLNNNAIMWIRSSSLCYFLKKL